MLMVLLLALVCTAMGQIPLPPKQGTPWEAPKSTRLPTSWIEATGELLKAGLADPRGCPYHEIDITFDYHLPKPYPQAEVFTTHGWLLPDQKHAVCWSGWVYPISRVGEKVSLAQDVWKMMAKSPVNWRSWGSRFQFERWTLEKDRFLPIRVALLIVIGKTDLAEDHWGIWKVLLEKEETVHRENPLWLFAQDWLDSGKPAAIGAFRRRQDTLAASIINQSQAAADYLRPLLIEVGFIDPKRSDPLSYLGQMKRIAGDIRRRVNEDQPLPEDWLKLSLEDYVKNLEHTLGTVDYSGSSSGSGDSFRAAERLGDPLVPLLIDCLEHDDRLTRADLASFDRYPGQRVLPVSGLSYVILTRILKTRQFGDDETYYDPMTVDKQARKEMADVIRAYWELSK